MKQVTAIVKPHKIQDVKEALIAAGFSAMTVCEVKGFGRQKGHKEIYRGSEYQIDFISKVELRIVIDDDKVETACDAIKESAATGAIGDGKIFVSSIEEAIRIRTGETGSEAL